MWSCTRLEIYFKMFVRHPHIKQTYVAPIFFRTKFSNRRWKWEKLTKNTLFLERNFHNLIILKLKIQKIVYHTCIQLLFLVESHFDLSGRLLIFKAHHSRILTMIHKRNKFDAIRSWRKKMTSSSKFYHKPDSWLLCPQFNVNQFHVTIRLLFFKITNNFWTKIPVPIPKSKKFDLVGCGKKSNRG